MKTILFSFSLFAVLQLLAADATGKWTGSLKMVTAQGEEQTRTAYLILKQDGAKLSGSAGPDAGEQFPIQEGTVDGNNLVFAVPAGQATMRFKLKHEEEEITGEVIRERDGQIENAKLAVKREK